MQPLLAIAREGEERVVDPEGEAHPDQHVLGEDGEVVRLREERHKPERDDDRGDGEHERHEAGDDRAEDEQQDDERERSAEEELAFLQILERCGVLVGVRDQVAGDRRPVAGLVVKTLDGVDHVLDVILPVPAEGQEEDGRVAVLRDEPPVLAVGDDSRRSRRTELIGKRSDTSTRRGRFDLAVLGPNDDDVGDRFSARGLLGKALGEDPVGLLRLGRPRDLGFALEREERRHEHECSDDGGQPETHDEPRVPTARPSEPLGHGPASFVSVMSATPVPFCLGGRLSISELIGRSWLASGTICLRSFFGSEREPIAFGVLEHRPPPPRLLDRGLRELDATIAQLLVRLQQVVAREEEVRGRQRIRRGRRFAGSTLRITVRAWSGVRTSSQRPSA